MIIYSKKDPNITPIYRLISRQALASRVKEEITGLSTGDYFVSIFVLEKDGVPYHTAATTPKRVSIVNCKPTEFAFQISN